MVLGPNLKSHISFKNEANEVSDSKHLKKNHRLKVLEKSAKNIDVFLRKKLTPLNDDALIGTGKLLG